MNFRTLYSKELTKIPNAMRCVFGDVIIHTCMTYTLCMLSLIFKQFDSLTNETETLGFKWLRVCTTTYKYLPCPRLFSEWYDWLDKQLIWFLSAYFHRNKLLTQNVKSDWQTSCVRRTISPVLFLSFASFLSMGIFVGELMKFWIMDEDRWSL